MGREYRQMICLLSHLPSPHTPSSSSSLHHTPHTSLPPPPPPPPSINPPHNSPVAMPSNSPNTLMGFLSWGGMAGGKTGSSWDQRPQGRHIIRNTTITHRTRTHSSNVNHHNIFIYVQYSLYPHCFYMYVCKRHNKVLVCVKKVDSQYTQKYWNDSEVG